MKFIIIIIIFSIGFATDIESAEPLSEVCSVYRQRHETFCHCSHCGVSLCAVRGKAYFREFHTLRLLELASFSLQDFLCITFVVCTFVRHVHVDLFYLLLCAFLHADTCAVHVCFVDESLLFLQHLELHNFFYIKQYSQTSCCLMGNSQYCYRLANMAGYYILQNRKMREFNIHKLC